MENVFGCCPPQFRMCLKCGSNPSISYDISGFEWARLNVCSNENCRNGWVICKICESMRHPLPNVRDRIMQHHRDKHQNEISPLHDNNRIDVVDDDVDSCVYHVDEEEIQTKYKGYDELLSDMWSNISNSTNDGVGSIECEHENIDSCIHKYDYDNGPAKLVHTSQKATTYSANDLSDDEVKTHILYASFCYNLSPNDREMLGDVISGIIRCTERRCSKHNAPDTSSNGSKHDISTNIPVTDMDLRRCYLSGCNSVVDNLPIPTVQTIQEHAYVSLRDVISHILAFDIAVDPILERSRSTTNVSLRTETVLAQNIYEQMKSGHSERCQLILPITEWSDDFEPNTQEKQNSGSVWVHSTLFLCHIIVPLCSTPMFWL